MLKPSHFKRLVAIEFPDANGITLVGKQTETGYISQGEIDQNSTFIFRKMPDYLIEVEITFEFSVSPKKADELIQDIVKIVQSVRIRG